MNTQKHSPQRLLFKQPDGLILSASHSTWCLQTGTCSRGFVKSLSSDCHLFAKWCYVPPLDSCRSGRGLTHSRPPVLHPLLSEGRTCRRPQDVYGIDMHPKAAAPSREPYADSTESLQKPGMGHTPSNRHRKAPLSLHSQPLNRHYSHSK